MIWTFVKTGKKLVRHGYEQMLLRRKFYLQEPHEWSCDVRGAVRHGWKAMTLAAIAAHAIQTPYFGDKS